MKILVIGDSHGNIVNIKHVMKFAEKLRIKNVIHTGDWNNLKAVDAVFEADMSMWTTVLGNADIDEDMQKLRGNPSKAFKDFTETTIDGRKIYVVHNFKKTDKRHLGKDIVFTGHYHSQKEWFVDGVKIVRPGALENGINFAVYDTVTNNVEFIHD